MEPLIFFGNVKNQLGIADFEKILAQLESGLKILMSRPVRQHVVKDTLRTGSNLGLGGPGAQSLHPGYDKIFTLTTFDIAVRRSGVGGDKLIVHAPHLWYRYEVPFFFVPNFP